VRAGEEEVVVEAELGDRAVDGQECRRLAKTLDLDAVGVLHRDARNRTLTWWTAPGAPALPMDVDAILDGRSDGWIVAPRGGDVVIGRMTDRSSTRSVAALRSLMCGPPRTWDETGVAAGTDALEHDRARWAYAIHDGLTQIVTAVILDLEWQSRQVSRDPAAAGRALTEGALELRTALEEIRSILAVVTPDDDERPSAGSLDELVRRVSQRWHVPASWSIDGDLESVPAPVIEAATSVIRESVANAAKHSSARGISVRVQARPTEIEVSVEDAGRGFKPREVSSRTGHLGLDMMRRRVEDVHGTLDIESEPGRGTRVVARLPVGEGETP
jgi:signal transduction histidine kinase